MIEIEANEDGLQRADVAVVQFRTRNDIEGRHPMRREAVSHQLIEFLRHQMKRNIAPGEGIDHDEVVSLAVAFQEYSAVTIDEARLARFANSKIFLGNVDHAKVEFD